ncbi:hypothetical protein QY885_00940 [Latilactobacillus sakei]
MKDKDQKKLEIAKKQYKKLANRPLAKERKKAVGTSSIYLFVVVAIILIVLAVFLKQR